MDENQKLIRQEMEFFFNRVELVMGLANNHQIKVLELLPEAERSAYLITSQTNVIGLVETAMEKSFEVVNKVVDHEISR